MVKVISLSEEAYMKLKSIKGERSFSEVVVELTEKTGKGSLLDLFGKWPGGKEELTRIKKVLEEERSKAHLRETKW